MKFSGWYSILAGLLMFGQWGFFLSTGAVPELQTEPIRIGFHLAARLLDRGDEVCGLDNLSDYYDVNLKNARLRQLEAELRAEGLFDRPKRPLPRFPEKLGVVAALGGAALRDVLEVTARRAPGIGLLIAPAAAQGERCVPETLLAIQELQDPHWGCEALLLVRGGGSLEDLWAFNDPELVRAVADCRIPVITGVGHEIDTTLVDLAADRRAATPSQAAELATPDRAALGAELRRRVEALVPIKPRANTDVYAPYLEALSDVRLGLVDPELVDLVVGRERHDAARPPHGHRRGGRRLPALDHPPLHEPLAGERLAGRRREEPAHEAHLGGVRLHLDDTAVGRESELAELEAPTAGGNADRRREVAKRIDGEEQHLRARRALARVHRHPPLVLRFLHVGVQRALREALLLGGQHILHAGRFKHGTDGFARNDPGAGRGRPQQHLGSAIVRKNFVRDRRVSQGHIGHLLFGNLPAFADGISHFAGFAQAQTHYPAGVEGIKGASLPPPGVYFRDYNWIYFSDDFKDGPPAFAFDLFANVQAPRLIWITGQKVLGGYYGMDVIVPFVFQDLDMTGFRGRDFSVGDIFVERRLPFIVASRTCARHRDEIVSMSRAMRDMRHAEAASSWRLTTTN